MDIRKWLSPGGAKQSKPQPKRKAQIAISDDEDGDGSAFSGQKKKPNPAADKPPAGRECKKEVKRKRINYIDSSESEDEKAAVATDVIKKTKGATSRYFDDGRSTSKSKSPQASKKDATATDFFGDTKVKQTPSKKNLLQTKKASVTTVIPETPVPGSPAPADESEDPLDEPEFEAALLEASDAAMHVPETPTTPLASPRKSARLSQNPAKPSTPHVTVSSATKLSQFARRPKQSPGRPSTTASPTKASTTVEPAAKADVCLLKETPSVTKQDSPKPKAKLTPSKGDSAANKKRAASPAGNKPTTPSAKPPSVSKDVAEDVDESPAPAMKRGRGSFYEFKNREGPRNIGTRKLPEGAENCLGGKTFIITGILESIEREDAQELVTRHGGKLTQTVGKRTDYVVTGREPGPAKIEKANKFGIKQITEEEFFDLIESSPAKAYDSAGSTPSKGKASGKKAIVLGAAPEDEIPAVTTKKSKSVIPAVTTKKASPSPSTVKSSASTSASGKSPASSSFYPSSASSKASAGNGSLSSKLSSNAKEAPAAAADGPEPSLLWVDKYRPRTLKQLIGQQGDKSNMNKLLKWLKSWHHNLNTFKGRPDTYTGAGFRAALLSGPPGIGKTTTATLVCQEAGFHYVELNASDTRSKNSLHTVVAQSLDNQTINGMLQTDGKQEQQQNALLMDEVDGMAGNEDRGGMQELVTLIKSTKMPIICMCNDRNSAKIRSLSNYCFDLRFQRPRMEQIRGAMMSVACREGISVKPPVVDLIITAANNDIRQVLHHLYLYTIRDRSVSYDQAKEDSSKIEKNLKMSPFEVIYKVFSLETGKKSLHEQLDLFFQDYSLMPLFVQEMYPKVRPRAANNSAVKTLECMANAADTISQSDLVEKAIRSTNNWGLLPLQGMLSTVVPGMIMRGSLNDRVDFPSWLGKRSKQSKAERLLQEISLHSRLTTSVSKVDMCLDMLPHLHNAVVLPLVTQGSAGADESVEKMTAYSLLREDLDSLSELNTFPPKDDPFSKLDSKTKAAFTRHFNKTAPNTTFSVTSGVLKATKRKAKAAVASDGEDGDEGAESEEEEQDVAALLQKKKKAKPAAAAASGRGAAKANGRGGGSKGRGRGKGR